PAEAELEDADAGQVEAVAKPLHLRGHDAEIFGDELQRSALALEPLEDVAAAAQDPAPAQGGLEPRRHRPGAVEADEVVDAHRVEAREGRAEARQPPAVVL